MQNITTADQGIQSPLHGNHERGRGEFDLHEHAGTKTHAGVRNLDASGACVGLRVDGSIEKTDSPM